MTSFKGQQPFFKHNFGVQTNLDTHRTPQLTQPFAVATFVMYGRPAAVAASFGVSTTILPVQQQQDSHASKKQQQLTAAFTWVHQLS